MEPSLLARIGTLPGYSGQRLPLPTERLLQDLTAAFDADEAFDLLLRAAYAHVYTRDLATEAAAMAQLVAGAGKLLADGNVPAAAAAVVHRMPDWERAVQALLAAAPEPHRTLPAAETEDESWERTPFQDLGAALFGLHLRLHWLLYCHLPAQKQPVAAVFVRHLPAALRRNVLGSSSAADHALKHAAQHFKTLAALIDEALGPYPSRARWQVLSWASDALHNDRPAGLRTFARALAARARTWPDAAFDHFLREVVLAPAAPTDPPELHAAEVLKFRRQPDRRAVLDALHALGRTTPEAQRLATFLEEIAAMPAAPAPPPPPADALPLANIVLRLAIVNELMYTRAIIKPRFEVWEWVKTYEQREIDIEEEGYDIIPEALAYFEQLPLTPALLARVKALDFEFGRPAFVVLSQVMPFIDGEGDEFWLTNLAEVGRCPNLERFFLCNLAPDFPAPDLAPLLQLAHLKEAHLDPQLSADPAYQELARRGVLR